MPAPRQVRGFGLGGEAGDEETGTVVVFAVEGVWEIRFGGGWRGEGG